MDAENIRSISQSIKTVVSKLNTFTRTAEFYSRSTLHGINDALAKIKQLVKNDVDAMNDMVNNYKQAYDAFLDKKIDHLLNFLESADDYLDYLEVRSESELWDYYLKVPRLHGRGNTDRGWSAFTLAMGVFDVLRTSLLSVKEINSMVPIVDLDESVRKALPIRLWSSNERWRTCDQLFSREANAYKYVLRTIYEALYIWQESDKREGWPPTWEKRLNYRRGNINLLKGCAREYRDIITRALGDISDVKSAAEETLSTGTSFDPQAFEDSLKEDLKAIRIWGSWLDEQLLRYYTHNTSKLDLAQTLLTVKTQDDIARYMETILFKTDLSAVFKLETDAQRLNTNMQKWYVAALSAVNSLLGYVDRDEMESKMRNISLWRKPVVDLHSPEVLKFSYSFDETSRTWPSSVSLQNLITPDGSRYISDILEGYMSGLGEAMYEVQRTSQASKEETVTEFRALWEDLQSYVRHSQIDDRFIR